MKILKYKSHGIISILLLLPLFSFMMICCVYHPKAHQALVFNTIQKIKSAPPSSIDALPPLVPLDPFEWNETQYKRHPFQSRQALISEQYISLDFRNILIHSALQHLADLAHINIIVSDAVKGRLTLKLTHLPWKEALDMILMSAGLSSRQLGHTYLIETIAQDVAREKQAHDTALKSLTTSIIQVHEAKADDIANLIKHSSNTLLSERGLWGVDGRTNSIWVQDNEAKIEEVKAFIKKLDVPIQQVLIETRIVEVTRNVALDLGIHWGIVHPNHANEVLANATPVAEDSTATLMDKLNVDLGVQASAGMQPASIAMAVAHLGAHVLLDMELSALENENKAKVIASPRVMTANQQEAHISSGQHIPYQQSTSSGATAVSFIQAVLSLRVTPQIMPNHHILMKLKINQDRASTTMYNGVPAITTKEVNTEVLVHHGETLVLGGIFRRDREDNVVRVPFFGSLPFVGALFKKIKKMKQDNELLIFITPKIIT